MDTQTLMLIGMGLVAVAALSYVFLAPTQKDKTAARAARVGGPAKSAGKGQAGKAPADSARDRRKHVQESLNKIDQKQKEAAARKKVQLFQRIERSGLAITERDFYIASLICAILMACLGFVSGQKPMVILAMFVAGGLGLPRWALGFLTKRRQKKFVNEFSNAIEVIVRGVKSGLPVNECLKIIARDAQPPVAEEFHMLVEGQKIGLSLEQGLDRMYDRMPLNEVNFFAIVLIIQKQTGGNLAEALGNLATVLRNRKLMEGKIAALSMEAKASAVILGSMPFMVAGMVHLSSPEYLQPLWSTPIGNMILMGAGTWMSIGLFVMKNMISIKV